MTCPQYLQLNKGGAMARLSILKMRADAHNRNRPPSTQIDWREAREWNFKNWRAAFGELSQGLNDGQSVWYCHTGPQFRNEDYCDVIDVSIRHTGWFCDIHQDEKARGIVGSLTHGRFLAGYELSANGERVYFNEVFTDETDAARAADSHAESIAEQEREYNERWNDARELEDENESALVRLRECIALRHNACMDYVRDEISGLIETIRTNRTRLDTEFKGVL